MRSWMTEASFGDAVRPVPIAQTGSYAMTSRWGSLIFAG